MDPKCGVIATNSDLKFGAVAINMIPNCGANASNVAPKCGVIATNLENNFGAVANLESPKSRAVAIVLDPNFTRNFRFLLFLGGYRVNFGKKLYFCNHQEQ